MKQQPQHSNPQVHQQQASWLQQSPAAGQQQSQHASSRPQRQVNPPGTDQHSVPVVQQHTVPTVTTRGHHQQQRPAQQLLHAQLSPAATPITVQVPLPPGPNSSAALGNDRKSSGLFPVQNLFASSSKSEGRNVGFTVTPQMASQHEKHHHDDTFTQQRINDGSIEANGNNAIQFQCLVTKLRSWRTGYTRLLVLTDQHLITFDPNIEHLPQTNKWQLTQLRVTPVDNEHDTFHLHLFETKERLKFQCHQDVPRFILLSFVLQLQESILFASAGPGPGHHPQALQSTGPIFPAQRWTRLGTRYPVMLQCKPYALLELHRATGKTLQTYRFADIAGISLAVGHEHAIHVYFQSGPHKIRQWEITPNHTNSSPRSNLVTLLGELFAKLGLSLQMKNSISVEDWLGYKRQFYEKLSAAIVTTWPIRKATKRHDSRIVGSNDAALESWVGGVVSRTLCLTSNGWILERDGGTIVSCRKMSDLIAVVRPLSAGDEVVLEYRNDVQIFYQSTQRDALIVSLLDALVMQNASNRTSSPTSNNETAMNKDTSESTGAPTASLLDHSVSGYALTWTGSFDKMDPNNAINGQGAPSLFAPFSVPAYCLKRVYSLSTQAFAYLSGMGNDVQTIVDSGSSGQQKTTSVVAETAALQRACREFNVNIPATDVDLLFPLSDTNTKKFITGSVGALSGLLSQLLKENSTARETGERAVGERTAAIFLQTLYRLAKHPHGYSDTAELDTFQECIPLFTGIGDNFCKYCAFQLLDTLISGSLPERNMEAEFVNKSVILNSGGNQLLTFFISALLEADKTVPGGASDLILMVSSDILQSILCSYHDTTSPPHFSAVISALARRYQSLLAALRSPTPFVIENAALLLHLLSTHSPETASKIREEALSSAVLLKHFHAAIFSPVDGQKFLSRFLCSLWLSGPADCPEKRLLRRIVPHGFLPYLNMPGLSKMEQEQLDSIERDSKEADSSSTRLLVSSGAAGTNAERLRSRIRLASAASAKKEQRLENFRIFFHVLTQDHSLPDLIWSQQTRRELCVALESEIEYIEREKELRGENMVAWNHQQFKVEYPSLDNEIKVGAVYMRLWLNAGNGFIKSWEDPVRLFELLFRRLLCEINRNDKVAIMSLRCLERLYAMHSSSIGPFSDMMILVHSMAQTTSMDTQHRLLEFLATLLGVSKEEMDIADIPENAEQLLNPLSIGQLCQFVAWAHTNSLQVESLLGRAISKATALKTLPSPGNTEPDASDREERLNDSACPPVWYTASTGKIPPPSDLVMGPFRLSDLRNRLEQGELSQYDLVASSSVEDYDENSGGPVREDHIDTGKWKRLNEVWQLRWQLCTDGSSPGIYSPADVALLSLRALTRLVELHKSLDSNGIPYIPIPTAKRLLSNRERQADMNNNAGATPISILTQALLSNDSRVVDQSATILNKLLQHNREAMPKFYLTGAYFFMLCYTGSNFSSITRLLQTTHLHQNFRSGAAATAGVGQLPLKDLSVLGSMLPEGLILILQNYGPERFSEVFVSSADTPEVIWTLEMRKHLVDMIRQHLGDFPLRLFQNNTTEYEFCPIPKISYGRLQPEIFCHNYYLKNLCDEARFPDWPIAEPLEVLKSCLRLFMADSEDDEDNTEILEKARQLLKLHDGDGSKELRKAYRMQARLYHPDKNPGGRDMFEAIQKAYELWLPIVERGSTIQAFSSENEMNPDSPIGGSEVFVGGIARMKVLHLLIRTQLLLYRRFEKDMKSMKYPGYHILLECVRVPSSWRAIAEKSDGASLLSSGLLQEPRVEMMTQSVELIFRTCLVSPMNGKELILQGGVQTLSVLLRVAKRSLDAMASEREATDIVRSRFARTVEYILRTLGGLGFYDEGRESILAFGSMTDLMLDWKQCIEGSVDTDAQNSENSIQLVAIEGIEHFAKNETLRLEMVRVGFIWPLLRLLLCFDPTVEEDKSSAHPTNMNANSSVRALAAISGATPGGKKLDLLTNVLEILLTKPIARMLPNRRTKELLLLLNSNVEEPCRVWNVAMRKELEAFIDTAEKARAQDVARDIEEELGDVRGFEYSYIASELHIGGVFVRIFNAQGKDALTKIPDVQLFATSLLTYIAMALNESGVLPANISLSEGLDMKNGQSGYVNQTFTPQFDMAVKAICLLGKLQAIHDVAEQELCITTLFGLLYLAEHSDLFDAACETILILCQKNSFGEAVACYGVLWQLLALLEKSDVASSDPSDKQGEDGNTRRFPWSILEALSSCPAVAKQLVVSSAWLELLGVLVGYEAFTKSWISRLGAAKTLARILSDSSTGVAAAPALERFLPSTLIILLKDDPEAMLRSFDSEFDSPELIWDSAMRAELRSVVAVELDNCLLTRSKKNGSYLDELHLEPHVRVKYSKLEKELNVGGVYVRKYLEDPTYNLSDPTKFVECLLQTWVKEVQNFTEYESDGPAADSNELAQAGQDVLQVVTDALVFILKVREALCDKLSEWGYIPRLIAICDRSLKRDQLGTRLVASVRLLKVSVNRMSNVEAVAMIADHDKRGGIVDCMLRAMGIETQTLHPHSTSMIETLYRTYEVALGDVNNLAIAEGTAAAPSPASTDSLVGDPRIAQIQGYLAMAPSPAPGDGPTNQNRMERVHLGDDPLAMFGADPSPPTNTMPYVSPPPTQNNPVPFTSPPPQNNPVPFTSPPPQNNPVPYTPSSSNPMTFMSQSSPQTNQVPHTPPSNQMPYTSHSNPLSHFHPHQQQSNYNQQQVQALSSTPQYGHHQQWVQASASGSQTSYQASQSMAPQSFRQGQFQEQGRVTMNQGGAVPSRNSYTQGPQYASPRSPAFHNLEATTNQILGQSPYQGPPQNTQLSSGKNESGQHVGGQHKAEQTYSQGFLDHKTSTEGAAEGGQTALLGSNPVGERSHLPESANYDKPNETDSPQQGNLPEFAIRGSLGANSLNQPPSTVLDTAPQQSAKVHTILSDDDDDDSTGFGNPSLMGTNPLPQDPLFGSVSATAPQESSYSSQTFQNPSEPLVERSIPPPHPQPVTYSQGPASQEAPHSTGPSSPAMVVDARTPQQPAMKADQQASSQGGAPGSASGREALLQQALACQLCEFLVHGFLEHPNLERIKDGSVGKVHAIALLKLLMKDPGFGMKFKLILDDLPAWKKYRSQDHSLLVTSRERTDYFLTDSNVNELKMLTHE